MAQVDRSRGSDGRRSRPSSAATWCGRVAEALADGAPVATSSPWPSGSWPGPRSLALASVGRGGEIRHTTLELLDVERRLLRRRRPVRQGGRASHGRAPTRWPRPCVASRSSPTSRSRWCGASRPRAPASRSWWARPGAGKTLALAAARTPGRHSGSEVHRHRAVGPGGPGTPRRGRHRVATPWPVFSTGLEQRHDRALAPRRGRPRRGRHGRDAGPGRAWSKPPGGRGPRWCWSATRASCPRSRPAAPSPPSSSGSGPSSSPRTGVSTRPGSASRSTPCAWAGPRSPSPPTSAPAGSTPPRPWPRPESSWSSAGLESHLAGHDAVMLALSRSEVGALNEPARAALRRRTVSVPTCSRWARPGSPLGDKVVCLRNDRRLGVLNGTVGTVERPAWRSGSSRPTDGPRASAAALPRGRSPGSRLCPDRAQGPGPDGRAGLRARQRVAHPRGRLRGHEPGPLGHRALRARSTPAARTRSGHDLRHQSRSTRWRALARRLGTSRAKQLALSELAPTTTQSNPPARTGTVPDRSGLS